MVTTTLGVSEVSTAVDQRREGIIAKRRDSRYPPAYPRADQDQEPRSSSDRARHADRLEQAAATRCDGDAIVRADCSAVSELQHLNKINKGQLHAQHPAGV